MTLISPAMPPTIIHDKTPQITSFLRPLLLQHGIPSKSDIGPTTTTTPPFFLGISGIQGAGKTTLTTHLHQALTSEPYNLRVLTLSIDDLYHPYDQLTALAAAHPQNPFLRQRGPPGTHDIRLGEHLFERLTEQDAFVKVPAYDKSAYGGIGDRVPENSWKMENGPWDVVILEGWCVGFTPVGEQEVQRRWKDSSEREWGTLRKHELENLLWLNTQLKNYANLWEKFGALVHVDAEDLEYVYEWRIQQEHGLIKLKGSGMTDEQVRAFVDSYMPSYELYLPGLREPPSQHLRKRPCLRFVVGRDRNAVITETLGI